MLCITGYRLMFTDWRGYIISGFALVWVANIYIGLFALLRQNIKLEKIKGEVEEVKLDASKSNSDIK